MSERTSKLISLAVAACVAGLAGCNSGPKARVLAADEAAILDVYGGGIAAYQAIVADAVTQLLTEHSRLVAGQGLFVAFVGIENKSAEELREFEESIYEQIDTALVESRIYQNVSRRMVDAALGATGLRTEELFLAKPRSEFMSVITEQGVTPEFLLFAKFTSQVSRGADEKQRDYYLTLEMVDSQTGLTQAKKMSKPFRKAYSR